MDSGFWIRDELVFPDGRRILLNDVHNRLQTTFGILKAGLVSGKETVYIKYLEIGSGDVSWDASPPPPDPGTAQTGLLAPIARVGPFTGADWSYMNAGVVSGTPTNTVMLTATVAVGVGNGVLREAALWGGTTATASLGTGILVNVVRHVAISKPAGTGDFALTRQLTVTFS